VRGVVAARVRSLNNHPVNAAGQFVLYWMTAFRRTRWNFALQQAAAWVKDLAKPLLVLETLSCGRRWDSGRLHRFVLDGMADNARAFRSTAVRYYPYVAPERDRANELVAALGQRACVVVTDDFPTHHILEALATTTSDLAVRAEAVDSNGLLPLRAAHRIFPSAYVFRRFLQSELRGHLSDFPKKTALARLKLPRLKRLPAAIGKRWPMATERVLRGDPDALRAFPIDHSVSPVEARGGADAAQSALRQFLKDRLPEYAEHRRYDRPWGPERPIFGKIRYMSSENTARKVRVAEYVRKYAP